MTAATSDASGIFRLGAKRPARPAASSAPSTIPRSITVVMSCHSGEARALALAGACQNTQLPTSTPRPSRALAPHKAKAEVIPHGRPARAKVA
ncbi:hypothetical protein D3C72_1315190 [compost metagenome]